jgi:hypothetical protein
MYVWQNIQKRIAHIKNPLGAEIGVYQGNLSRLLLENIPDLTLYMIDSWADDTYKDNPKLHEIYDLQYQQNYEKALAVSNNYENRSQIIIASSLKTANTFYPDMFDFVFIDASHLYLDVKLDINLWLPKVKKGGYICGHDYGNEAWPGVKQAVDEIFPDAEIDTDFTWFWRV